MVGALEELATSSVGSFPMDQVILVDDAGRVVRWPAGVSRLLRIREPPLGQPIDSCLFPSAPPPEGSLLGRLRSGGAWASALDPTLPERSAVWVAQPVVNKGAFLGATVRVSPGHVEPVSSELGTLAAAAFELAQEALVVVDANRRVVLINKAYRDASAAAKGRSLAPGDDLLITAAPGTETDVEAALVAARAGDVIRRRRKVRFPNGEEFLHTVQYRKLDDAGHVLMGAVTLPLTSEPEASLVSRTLDRGPVSLVICDASKPDLPIIYASGNLERLTGYRPEEVLGKNPRLFQGSLGGQPALDVVRRAMAKGEPCDVVLKNVRRDQTPFFNRLTLFPLRDELGAVTHFAAFQQDVTELHGLRVAAQREALAQTTATLLGTVLHDLRNVLTVAMTGSTLALEDVERDSEAALALGHVVAALQRAGAMTRTLLHPMHAPSTTIGQTNVAVLLETAQTMARYLLPATVLLHVDAPPPLGFVVGDEGSLERVVVNLILNARDALNGRGNIRLSVEYPAPEQVTLLVSDDGPGLPPEVLEHLFEPYVTTKGEELGTGLGLTSCRRLVEGAGGTLRVQTGADGTTWRIELQRPGVDAVQLATMESARTRLHGAGVLLVSADLPLRGALAVLLRRRGAHVTSVGALDAEDAKQADPTLLVVDASVADPATLVRFLEAKPTCRVLMLGEPSQPVPIPLRSLEKPFDGEALLREVASLLTPDDG